MSMSDRIAILNRGRIDQVGPPGDVYERPANPFVGRFLGEANLIEGTITPQFGDGTRLVLPSGHELRAPSGSRCSGGARGMLFIRPERIEITPGANAAGAHATTRSPAGSAAARFSATSCAMPSTSTALRRSRSTCRTPSASRDCRSAPRWCYAGRSPKA